MNAYDYKRLEADLPLLKGHAGQVTDFDFSPFNDNLLATSSEDGTIKLWLIPEEGVKHDITEWDGELKGHSKKVLLTKYHPCAENTLVSTAADNTVRIWDIENQANTLTYSGLKNQATAIDWSNNGSLLTTVSKDKILTVFDPRQEGSAIETTAHEGARPQKVVWAGNSTHLITVGFSKVSERQYAVWDARNMTESLIMKKLDDYNGSPQIFFDEDSGVLYQGAKGEIAVNFYQFSTSGPYLEYLTNFKAKEPGRGFSMMPKRICDINKTEVARAVRITTKAVEYVSFSVPRKTGGFSEDLYPPTNS